MKLHILLALLASLAVCMVVVDYNTTPADDFPDVWEDLLETHQEICTLRMQLFEIQVSHWRERVEASGGTTPEHMRVLIQLIKEMQAAIRLLKLEIEDIQ